ncbi:Ig-like domain-containing protein [Gallaecimonas xiamenensis]|uniref:Ig-like domain-containing protein n=1 Tax=Gallaecimonas xiamenensis TaxID=1207039 RepID=UPI00178C5038|nr:Ig-like domain-containing protein [Gallaecimonas xiamenensis]
MYVRRGCLLLPLLLAACGGGSGEESLSEQEMAVVLDEDSLWQQRLAGSSVSLLEVPSHGTLSINGAMDASYQPQANYFGPDRALLETRDGNIVTRLTLVFTVNPVNDAPVVEPVALLEATGDYSYQGQVLASDVDGDPLTFSLVRAPDTGTLLLSSDGHFSYQLDGLALPDQDMVVAVSDGQTQVQATVAFKASYQTNEEKAAYYYRWPGSYLIQAGQVADSLVSDDQRAPVLLALAVGYAQANLDTEVTRILDQQIQGQEARAKAYWQVAQTYLDMGLTEKGRQAALTSASLYNRFVADNGLDNLVTGDADFFRNISRRLSQEGLFQDAAQVQQIVQLYFDALVSQGYSTTLGKLLTSKHNDAMAMVLEALKDPSLHDTAVASADELAQMALAMPADKRGSYGVSLTYLSYAIKDMLLLGAEDKGKDYLADMVSYFQAADYDQVHVRAVRAGSELNWANYSLGLARAAGFFAYLYPGQDNVPLLALQAVADKRVGDAEEAIVSYQARRLALSGDAAGAAALLAGTDNALWERVRDLAYPLDNAKDGLAQWLWALGDEEGAMTVVDAKLALIFSDQYLETYASPAYVMNGYGNRGLIRFLMDIGQQQKALDVAQRSQAFVTEHYSQVTTLTLIGYYRDLANLWHLAGGHSQAAALIKEQLVPQLARLDSPLEQANQRLDAARLLANAGDFDAALEQLALGAGYWLADDSQADVGEEALAALLANTSGLLTFNAANPSKAFADNREVDGADTGNYLLMGAIKRSAASNGGYGLHYSAAYQLLAELLARIDQQAQLLPDVSQQALNPELSRQLAALGQWQQALVVAKRPVNLAVSSQSMLAIAAMERALTDDFTGTAVATVDTDHDGQPNFFAIDASSEAIAASGLVADQDADNDGIPDQDDLSPLGNQ